MSFLKFLWAGLRSFAHAIGIKNQIDGALPQAATFRLAAKYLQRATPRHLRHPFVCVALGELCSEGAITPVQFDACCQLVTHVLRRAKTLGSTFDAYRALTDPDWKQRWIDGELTWTERRDARLQWIVDELIPECEELEARYG